jgi:hypothetical protein
MAAIITQRFQHLGVIHQIAHICTTGVMKHHWQRAAAASFLACAAIAASPDHAFTVPYTRYSKDSHKAMVESSASALAMRASHHLARMKRGKLPLASCRGSSQAIQAWQPA